MDSFQLLDKLCTRTLSSSNAADASAILMTLNDLLINDHKITTQYKKVLTIIDHLLTPNTHVHDQTLYFLIINTENAIIERLQKSNIHRIITFLDYSTFDWTTDFVINIAIKNNNTKLILDVAEHIQPNKDIITPLITISNINDEHFSILDTFIDHDYKIIDTILDIIPQSSTNKSTIVDYVKRKLESLENTSEAATKIKPSKIVYAFPLN